MTLTERLRSTIKAGRKRGSPWVRFLDVTRLILTGEGRGQLWTRLTHGGELHQTTPQTAEDRYPELFDLAARLAPGATRVLSFGCSTGQELAALRQRFPGAEIVGAEINPRSRRIAQQRFRHDAKVSLVHPSRIDGRFDIIFALAVLQREPHKVAETDLQDLSRHYPFDRFDAAVSALVGHLRSKGLLCVINSHYRIEDSSAAIRLRSLDQSTESVGPFFSRDGRRLTASASRTIFRKSD